MHYPCAHTSYVATPLDRHATKIVVLKGRQMGFVRSSEAPLEQLLRLLVYALGVCISLSIANPMQQWSAE